MPTGYTAAVQDGTITEFSEFALQCARAFGALVTMRDESSSAQIPDEFQPSDYHRKELESAETRLILLGDTTPLECDAAAQVTFNEIVASRAKRQSDRLEQMARYTAMRSKVEEWVPPTPEHIGLRNFMLEQLDSSIKFDCETYEDALPVLQTGAEWIAIEKARAERDICYHTKENLAEIKRTATRNSWVKALRNSLSGKVLA